MYFNVVDNFSHICKMLLSSGDILWLASISEWMIQCVDSHSEAIFLTQVVKPESHSVMSASLFMHRLTQNDQFSFPDV